MQYQIKRILIICIIILASCTGNDKESKYLRWVGDSEFNPEIDEGFEICGSENFVQQYFHLENGIQYKGEKRELERQYKEQYQPVDIDESGWIRIRFIINCKGEAGRFRMMASDLDYQEKVFDERITDQLLSITKSLDGWVIQARNDRPQDYYQYLIFRIEKGNLIDIMP